MAGGPSPWWERGIISDICFPFQPRRLRRRQCLCALSATRCSSSDETGPVSSCVLHCLRPGTVGRHPCHWEPGLFGSQHGIPLPEDGLHLCSSCQRQAGWTSPPCHAPAGSLWWSTAHSCAPSLQLLRALGALWHLLCPATCLPRPFGLAQ